MAKYLEWGLSAAIGGLFIYSGIMKLLNPAAFLDQSVMSFQLVNRSTGWVIAIGLPWFEVIAGMCLVFRKFAYKAACWNLFLLTLLFSTVVSFSWARGLDINCGCFGVTENTTNYPWKLASNGLIAAALAHLCLKRQGPRYPHTPIILAEGTEDVTFHRRR